MDNLESAQKQARLSVLFPVFLCEYIGCMCVSLCVCRECVCRKCVCDALCVSLYVCRKYVCDVSGVSLYVIYVCFFVCL